MMVETLDVLTFNSYYSPLTTKVFWCILSVYYLCHRLQVNAMLHRLFRFLFPQASPEEIKHKYHLPENLNLNIELTKDGWYVVESPDLPGLITQARNRQELLDMVNDAVLTYFDVPKREADYIYDELRIGTEVVRYQAQLRTA